MSTQHRWCSKSATECTAHWIFVSHHSSYHHYKCSYLTVTNWDIHTTAVMCLTSPVFGKATTHYCSLQLALTTKLITAVQYSVQKAINYRTLYRSEERWMFSAASVCSFVGLCVCQHDNFKTSRHRRWNLGVDALYKNLGRVRIWGLKFPRRGAQAPKMWHLLSRDTWRKT